MRYIVMHKVDVNMEAGVPPDHELVKNMGRLVGESLKQGIFIDGAGLHRSARRVRLRCKDGRCDVERGPYQGENELVASMALIRIDSIDAAVEQAQRLGVALREAEIEIGPVVEPWDLGLAEKPEGVSPRFLLLRKGDRAYEAGAAPPAGLQKVLDELARDGVVLSTAALAPSATGARYRKTGGKRAWTDGPFTESKELVAGFAIIEASSKAEAIELTKNFLAVAGDGECEVREVYSAPDQVPGRTAAELAEHFANR